MFYHMVMVMVVMVMVRLRVVMVRLRNDKTHKPKRACLSNHVINIFKVFNA